jgi:hypothetical protein
MKTSRNDAHPNSNRLPSWQIGLIRLLIGPFCVLALIAAAGLYLQMTCSQDEQGSGKRVRNYVTAGQFRADLQTAVEMVRYVVAPDFSTPPSRLAGSNAGVLPSGLTMTNSRPGHPRA